MSREITVHKSVFEWYLEPWKKYSTFSGRATRREYWIFNLPLMVGSLLYVLAAGAFAGEDEIMIFFTLMLMMVAAVTVLPWTAVGSRRLQDTGRHGAWVLLFFVPCLGLVLFVVLLLKGQVGAKDFGPDPRVRVLGKSLSDEDAAGDWGSGSDVDA